MLSLHQDVERVLFSEKEIEAGLERVAAEIAAAYPDGDFTVVAVLKGSCVFVADLIRRIPRSLELAFAAASSYRSGTTGGDLDVLFFPDEREIEGRRLLLVDDILDSGRTMTALASEFLARGAAEVRSCVFLDKPARRAVDYTADFRCFEVNDVFVVGYGLDYQGRYRNLPYVGALKAEAIDATV